jgi:hypothetical protein
MLNTTENRRGVKGEEEVGGKMQGRRRREEERKGFYGCGNYLQPVYWASEQF